jgi:hypothetical protein
MDNGLSHSQLGFRGYRGRPGRHKQPFHDAVLTFGEELGIVNFKAFKLINLFTLALSVKKIS